MWLRPSPHQWRNKKEKKEKKLDSTKNIRMEMVAAAVAENLLLFATFLVGSLSCCCFSLVSLLSVLFSVVSCVLVLLVSFRSFLIFSETRIKNTTAGLVLAGGNSIHPSKGERERGCKIFADYWCDGQWILFRFFTAESVPSVLPFAVAAAAPLFTRFACFLFFFLIFFCLHQKQQLSSACSFCCVWHFLSSYFSPPLILIHPFDCCLRCSSFNIFKLNTDDTVSEQAGRLRERMSELSFSSLLFSDFVVPSFFTLFFLLLSCRVQQCSNLLLLYTSHHRHHYWNSMLT